MGKLVLPLSLSSLCSSSLSSLPLSLGLSKWGTGNRRAHGGRGLRGVCAGAQTDADGRAGGGWGQVLGRVVQAGSRARCADVWCRRGAGQVRGRVVHARGCREQRRGEYGHRDRRSLNLRCRRIAGGRWITRCTGGDVVAMALSWFRHRLAGLAAWTSSSRRGQQPGAGRLHSSGAEAPAPAESSGAGRPLHALEGIARGRRLKAECTRSPGGALRP